MILICRQLLTVILFLSLSFGSGSANCQDARPRLIVLTDISSLSQGEAEPDDGQSLVRLMLYTNELAIEGLVATSNLGHGQRTRPELIREVVNAYGRVHRNLLLHDKRYPAASELLGKIKEGQPAAGRSVPFDASVGHGKDTEGSEWIIEVVDRDDPRPVWIVAWGGTADLAQALWKVRATRSREELRKFIGKLRVHAVYDQDQTAAWIKSEFPDLFYIFRHHGIRGMYRGGDTTLVRHDWVERHIRNHHGALGDLYVNYSGGDIWGRTLGRVRGIKEGDTPSFLYLLSNGLNDAEHPEWGSWSGRFRKEDPQKQLWVEAVDTVAGYASDPDPRMAALYRWRADWQSDFAARLDWCTLSFAEANHAPRFDSPQPKTLRATPGTNVRLTAPRVLDPDRDRLNYQWFFYPEEGTFRGPLPQLIAKGKKAMFKAPLTDSTSSIHVILKATDSGDPALATYKRFIVVLDPD